MLWHWQALAPADVTPKPVTVIKRNLLAPNQMVNCSSPSLLWSSSFLPSSSSSHHQRIPLHSTTSVFERDQRQLNLALPCLKHYKTQPRALDFDPKPSVWIDKQHPLPTQLLTAISVWTSIKTATSEDTTNLQSIHHVNTLIVVIEIVDTVLPNSIASGDRYNGEQQDFWSSLRRDHGGCW